MPARGPVASFAALSDEGIGEFLEVGNDQVRLLGPGAEGLLAAVDEGGVEAIGLGADAVEDVVGNKQNTGPYLAQNLLSLGVGLPMGLEVARFLDRNGVVEGEVNVRFGRRQHVLIAVRQDG